MRLVHVAVLVTAVATGWLPIASAQTSASPVKTGRIRTLEVRVASVHGPVAARAIEVKTDVLLPRRGTEPGYLVAIYEPRSRAFWWQFSPSDPEDRFGMAQRTRYAGTFFLSESKLISFKTSYQVLWIKESTDHATTIREGVEMASASLATKLDEISRGDSRSWIEVDLSQLGREFFAKPSRADAYPTRIVSVSLSGINWDVTLHGADGNRIVTLDPSYKVLSTRRSEQ